MIYLFKCTECKLLFTANFPNHFPEPDIGVTYFIHPSYISSPLFLCPALDCQHGITKHLHLVTAVCLQTIHTTRAP